MEASVALQDTSLAFVASHRTAMALPWAFMAFHEGSMAPDGLLCTFMAFRESSYVFLYHFHERYRYVQCTGVIL